MIICPECSSSLANLEDLRCLSCDWRSFLTENIPSFIKSSDLADATLSSYIANYDLIAEEDLKRAIVDVSFVKNLARNLAEKAGNISDRIVCDIGSGKGYAARMLAARGAKVTAVDISIPYLKTLLGEESIQPVLANAENLPFRDHFDLIVSTDVMEHVLNLGSFLFCVNRALKMGGVF